jgi:hypothetical protein
MNSDDFMISIARDYSETPGGRYVQDGPFSGERFRDELLAPALRDHSRVEVDLDGALSLGSSFLEEAFGGLVRTGFSADELHSRLTIRASLSLYRERIWSYIDDAAVHA